MLLCSGTLFSTGLLFYYCFSYVYVSGGSEREGGYRELVTLSHSVSFHT